MDNGVKQSYYNHFYVRKSRLGLAGILNGTDFKQ